MTQLQFYGLQEQQRQLKERTHLINSTTTAFWDSHKCLATRRLFHLSWVLLQPLFPLLQTNREQRNHYNPTPSVCSFSNPRMTAMISRLCWQSPQLGLHTPLQALYQLFLSLVLYTQKELCPLWNFLAYANQSFKLYSATAPLGLAWLLAVLKLWWSTAWDLVLTGKLWLGRLLETLASEVSSKSQS